MKRIAQRIGWAFAIVIGCAIVIGAGAGGAFICWGVTELLEEIRQ